MHLAQFCFQKSIRNRMIMLLCHLSLSMKLWWWQLTELNTKHLPSSPLSCSSLQFRMPLPFPFFFFSFLFFLLIIFTFFYFQLLAMYSPLSRPPNRLPYEIVNSLWITKKYKIEKQFVTDTERVFQAHVKTVSFEDPKFLTYLSFVYKPLHLSFL